MITAFSTIISVMIALVAPGAALVSLLFHKHRLDLLERCAVTLGLSIAFLALAGFYLSYTGVRVTTPLLYGLIGALVACAVIVRLVRGGKAS